MLGDTVITRTNLTGFVEEMSIRKKGSGQTGFEEKFQVSNLRLSSCSNL